MELFVRVCIRQNNSMLWTFTAKVEGKNVAWSRTGSVVDLKNVAWRCYRWSKNFAEQFRVRQIFPGQIWMRLVFQDYDPAEP